MSKKQFNNLILIFFVFPLFVHRVCSQTCYTFLGSIGRYTT